VHDDIVDEHALLWFLAWSGDRPKLNCRGKYIPGTRVGAVSITGCQSDFLVTDQTRLLRPPQNHKQQEAQEPTLAAKQPTTTVHVYDAVKARMAEALQIVRQYVPSRPCCNPYRIVVFVRGLVTGEDAPDIVTNTFLRGICFSGASRT
jgi:hypothetical protein